MSKDFEPWLTQRYEVRPGRVPASAQGRPSASSGERKLGSSARSRPRSTGGAKRSTNRVVVLEGIPVKLVHRANMTTVRLRVDDAGQAIVSASPRVPYAEMERYAREHMAWVKAQQSKREGSPAFIAAHASKAEIEEWRAIVKDCVPPLVAVWEPILGVKAGTLTYRNMTSKWGSCQPSTGRICINIRLALYPAECLEYIVVHELCHLREANHGPRFHALMDAVMPDWRQRRAKLNA